MANPFFTIGHSTRTIAEFVGLLREAEVTQVVDVRTVPRSRTNPQFNRDVLGDATPLQRRMERYDVCGRTVLDDTAGHPRSLQAALDVASMLHHRHAAVVYAVRGSRGADINRRNALALADLTALHGFGTLIVTAASDAAGPADVVTPAETDATKQALVEKGCRFVWHDALAAAVQEAIERTAAGDLIVLLGAQGMNQGRRMIEAAG